MFTTREDHTVTAIAPAVQTGLDDLITPPTRPSYDSGVSDVPLLGDTIGGNFDRTAAAGPRREALVEVMTGRRWTYQELRAEVDVLALGLIDAVHPIIRR